MFTGNTKVYRVKVFFIKLILTKKLSSVWTIIYFVDLVPWQRFYFSVTTLKEFVITTKHKNSTLHECNATLKVKAVDMQMDTFHKILRNEPAVETSYAFPPHSLCSSAISRRGTDHGNTFSKQLTLCVLQRKAIFTNMRLCTNTPAEHMFNMFMAKWNGSWMGTCCCMLFQMHKNTHWQKPAL